MKREICVFPPLRQGRLQQTQQALCRIDKPAVIDQVGAE